MLLSNQLPLMGAIGHTRLSRRRSGYSDNFQKQVKSLNNISISLLEEKKKIVADYARCFLILKIVVNKSSEYPLKIEGKTPRIHEYRKWRTIET